MIYMPELHSKDGVNKILSFFLKGDNFLYITTFKDEGDSVILTIKKTKRSKYKK